MCRNLGDPSGRGRTSNDNWECITGCWTGWEVGRGNSSDEALETWWSEVPLPLMCGVRSKESRLSRIATTTEEGECPLPVAFQVNRRGISPKLFTLRQKLYRKAKAEPGFRFYTLFDRICRPDVLASAWILVAANDGAPGVDGVSIDDISERQDGVTGFLKEIRESLLSQTYKPQAVRRKMIPKANGGLRPLGIPTVRDRVVQQPYY
jgi:hypothetical protein